MQPEVEPVPGLADERLALVGLGLPGALAQHDDAGVLRANAADEALADVLGWAAGASRWLIEQWHRDAPKK